MIETIFKAAKSDTHLANFLGEVREYAHIYLFAKKRQKGCDNMGELATLKEECRDVIDKVIQYSQENEYISHDVTCALDAIADEIIKGDPLGR